MAWPAAQFVVPALLAVAYILLIWPGFGEAEGGGFGSIAEIRALFANDSALAAGWLHYLAFDLFVGSLDRRATGSSAASPGLLLLPCLPSPSCSGRPACSSTSSCASPCAGAPQPETI